MSTEIFDAAETQLRTLGAAQLRTAVPLLADMGHPAEEIRTHLLADLHLVRNHAVSTGNLPHRVFGEHAARLARLEEAGVRLAVA